MIRTTLVVLACLALIAPTAFAQTRSTPKRQATTTTEPITVTGTLIKITSEDGAAANYQPVKTLVVRQDRSNIPGTYVLNGPGNVVDKAGAAVTTAVKPNTRVRVYFTDVGNQRVIDHGVVVD